IKILKQLGVTIVINDEEIKIRTPEKLTGGKFDLGNSPDLLPPLAILALKSSAPIEIVNVKHARLKETDRIAIISRELVKLGIKIQERDDGLILEPSKNLKGAQLNSEKDHRLFMSFCIAGMYVGDCIITDPESVDISFPNFLEEMNRLGAKIQVN
ncbi:MAG: 3-phosphoshikimate 1-carboxyvinyltransferase, partial [Nitrosopumilus sp.]|nr:3-phosphoshikimate 1-carboxyvinyltransferase [Nitrosopumilus sp.]